MTNGEQPTRASQSGRANPQTESVRTVLVAGAANIVAAAAKVAAGLASGSSAMLAEAGHSVGDTVNEVLLLTGLRRGARGPDKDHPFGHGSASFSGRWWLRLAPSSLARGSLCSKASRPYDTEPISVPPFLHTSFWLSRFLPNRHLCVGP